MLQRIIDELGINIRDESFREKSAFRSPHVSPFQALKDRRPSTFKENSIHAVLSRSTPQYLTIDLSKLNNLDGKFSAFKSLLFHRQLIANPFSNVTASACRGCFLQLVRICAKRGISVCACNASARVEWMLRSHNVAYELEDEQRIKNQHSIRAPSFESTRLLLFVTIHEALEFCENALVHRIAQRSANSRGMLSNSLVATERSSLAVVFSRILGCSSYEREILNKLNGKRYHEELPYQAGQDIFLINTHSDAFFVV